MEAQCSARLSTRLPYFRDGGAHFVERRTQRAIEALARGGEVHAPRSAAHEGHAKACFESAHCLTHGRVGYAEAIPGRPKSLRFRNGNEGRHAIEFFSHW
jgi:hypothetical protein